MVIDAATDYIGSRGGRVYLGLAKSPRTYGSQFNSNMVIYSRPHGAEQVFEVSAGFGLVRWDGVWSVDRDRLSVSTLFTCGHLRKQRALDAFRAYRVHARGGRGGCRVGGKPKRLGAEGFVPDCCRLLVAPLPSWLVLCQLC